MKLLLALLLATPVSPAVASAPTPSHLPLAPSEVAGRWVFEIPSPGVVELSRIGLVLQDAGDGQVKVGVETERGVIPGTGTFDAATGRLNLVAEAGADVRAAMDLHLVDGHLVGTLDFFGDLMPVDAVRSSEASAVEPPLVVDFSVEAPMTVSLDGLDEATSAKVNKLIRAVMEQEQIVGLSSALIVDGKVIDIRSFGWQDFGERIPASDKTMYRWASITKPMTAIAALQLAEVDKLDLDADIREYVPEFPEKEYPFTARQLLCHQAGIVHYRNMGIRTLKLYEVEHPWADPIIAMDMFNERDLLFEPGTDHHYTTPGYVVLGAVIDRAGDGSYVDQVQKRICEPLGMTTMQPDYEWVDIPNRTRGYVARVGGQIVDSGTDNIAWKLPAGGWISTVGDLGRFGAGLMGDSLLDSDTLQEMRTAQVTRDGQAHGYGYGVGVRIVDDTTFVSHGGGQKKTSTFLLTCPELNVGVALMCNTQGARIAGLARSMFQLVAE